MTQPIDTAYVDIVARDRSLRKLRKDIDDTFDDIDKDVKKSLDDIDAHFDDTFTEIDEHFKTMTIRAKKSFDTVSDDAESSFRRIKRRFQEPLQQGFQKLTDIVTEAGRVIGQIGSGLGSFVSSSPLLVLIAVLTPAIIGLAAALSQLIGVVGIIPAGLGVLLSAIIPVVVAFQNFGDAVSALAEGDVDKINEALKKLSPSAAAVAKEVAALLPMLRSFQKVVQEGFFAPIVGNFTLTVRALFGVFEKGFFDVARAMGRLTSSFAELLTSDKNVQAFRDLFASTARIIASMMGPLLRFTDMLFSTMQAGLPFVERLAAALGRALDKFSAFVNASIENGDFDQFIEDAITTVKELIDLVKALGGLLGTLFAGTEDAGHGFIKTLTDLTIKLDEFLKTAEGQEAIDTLVFAIKALGFALTATLQTLMFFWGVAQNTFLGLGMLGQGFMDFVDTIVEWAKKIPGAVDEFFGQLPEKISGFFTDMFDRALQAIGIGTGLILFAIQVLPDKIAAFLLSLPQRIYDILIQIGPVIALALQGAVDFGVNIVTNGFNAIVDFIRGTPDRIRSLIPNFGKAGHSLIESFMNGFRAVGGFISDVAGDIVGAVKGFLNRAIDRINSGIATIDAVLPGDLGRLPRLADGAFVPRRPGGILANIGEGREDEWVLPQSKLDAMTGGSITFGPDSINVNFSGVVPTESEARATGAAVGQGIIDTITKRNIQVQVRAI